MRKILIIIAVLVFPFESSSSIINGDLDGGAMLSSAPPGWSSIYSPDTILPGGSSFGNGTVALGMPASPNGGSFVTAQAVIDSYNFFEGIEQNLLELEIGQIYRVSFYQANAGYINPGYTNYQYINPGFWNVELFGATQSSNVVNYLGSGNQLWTHVSLDFMATSSETMIRFLAGESVGNFDGTGMAIDGISIQAVPVPAALWLFGSGLIGLIGLARRKASI